MKRLSFVLVATLVGFTALSGSSCKTIQPAAFQRYRDAVAEVQTGTEQALELDYHWTREALVEKLAADPGARISNLIIETGEGYRWTSPSTNLFVAIKKTGQAANRLNALFLRYAELLKSLAGEESSRADFGRLAVDLNNQAGAAGAAIQEAAALHGQVIELPRKEVAAFSLGLSESLRLYEQRQRRRALERLIESNQPVVQTYADHGARLIRILTITLKKTYQDRAEALRLRWNTAAPEERQNIARHLLDLNDQLIAQLALLEEWEKAYKLLPAGHAELGTGLGRRQDAQTVIRDLIESGRRLQRLYRQLERP